MGNIYLRVILRHEKVLFQNCLCTKMKAYKIEVYKYLLVFILAGCLSMMESYLLWNTDKMQPF